MVAAAPASPVPATPVPAMPGATDTATALAASAGRNAPAAVSAREVRKSFSTGEGQVEILHSVSLAVPYGEMVAIMGPSGSGKSTLLYRLAGLEPATSEAVALAGSDVSRLSRRALARMRRSEVGFVFQSYNLVPTLTAAENVALPYTLAHKRPETGLVESPLASVGLAERAGARPPSMSGGEQQRVALARVLAALGRGDD